MKNNNVLYDYYLHYNPYTGYWNAVLRDDAVYYLNGTLGPDKVLKHKNVDDLIRYISKLEK